MKRVRRFAGRNGGDVVTQGARTDPVGDAPDAGFERVRKIAFGAEFARPGHELDVIDVEYRFQHV